MMCSDLVVEPGRDRSHHLKFCVCTAADEAGWLVLQRAVSPFAISSTALGFKEDFKEYLEIVLVMRQLRKPVSQI